MTKNRRYSVIALALALLMALSSFSVFAETAELNNEEGPGTPTTLTVTSNITGSSADQTLTLSWGAIEGAREYRVSIWNLDESTQPATKAYIVNEVYAGTNLTYSTPIIYDASNAYKNTYYYTVTAKYPTSKPDVVSEEASVVNQKPGTNLAISAARKHGGNDNGVVVSWSGTEGYDSYEILFGNTTDINAMSVLNTSTRSYIQYTSSNSLTYIEPLGGTFYYALRASKTVGDVSITDVSALSAGVYVNDGFIDTLQPIRWKAKLKKTATVYSTGSGKKKIGTIKKGTTIYPDGGRYPKKVKKFHVAKRVRISYNGTTGWVNWSSTKGVRAIVNVKNDYSTSLKEYFVNTQGYTSKTKYLVWCTGYTQRAYIFNGSAGNWTLQGSHRVTTGKYSQPTGARQSEIYKKKSKVYMVTEKGSRYYYKNASYFDPGVSFHTGTWWASGKKRGQVVKNGQPNTYGCIRMYNDGANAIYKLPMHTRVICTKNLA